MSNLSTLPKGDSAWLLRKAIERIIQQVSVLETNIGSSTTGNSANTQIIFNDAGTLRGDTGLTYNKTTDVLSFGAGICYGDLTVDTNTLKVDSANNRVGIGTATPAYKLEVVAPAGDNIVSLFRSGDATAANNAGGGFQSISNATAASRVARVWLDADGADLSSGDYFFIQKNGNSGTVEFNQSSNAAMTFLTNGTERYRIASDGVATWSNVGGVAGTAMTLNSTGLGIGATPIGKFDVYNTISDTTMFIRSDTAKLGQIVFRDNLDGGNQGKLKYDHSTDTLSLSTAATEQVFIDASGNLQVVGAATVQGLTVGKGAGTVATNSAFGVSALSLNTTASNGAAFGYQALKNNTANLNAAFGSNAGLTNTTGAENVFVGSNAGNLNLSGGNNTIVGASAGYTNSVGVNNTIMGAGAAYSATNSTNTVIGASAAGNLTTGASNVVIGGSAGNSSSVINLTTQSNRVVIGDANVTNAYILVAWTVTSDSRDKSDVQAAPYGLQFVNELIPITYKWDKRDKYENSTPDGTHKESKTQLGFLAQDVIALEKKHGGVAGDLLIADDETEESLKITETKFIPILVKAIQELTARVQTLEAR